MDVTEVDTPDVVWRTIGVEESTSVCFWQVDVFFGRCYLALEVAAAVGLEGIDSDFGVSAKV